MGEISSPVSARSLICENCATMKTCSHLTTAIRLAPQSLSLSLLIPSSSRPHLIPISFLLCSYPARDCITTEPVTATEVPAGQKCSFPFQAYGEDAEIYIRREVVCCSVLSQCVFLDRCVVRPVHQPRLRRSHLVCHRPSHCCLGILRH